MIAGIYLVVVSVSIDPDDGDMAETTVVEARSPDEAIERANQMGRGLFGSYDEARLIDESRWSRVQNRIRGIEEELARIKQLLVDPTANEHQIYLGLKMVEVSARSGQETIRRFGAFEARECWENERHPHRVCDKRSTMKFIWDDRSPADGNYTFCAEHGEAYAKHVVRGHLVPRSLTSSRPVPDTTSATFRVRASRVHPASHRLRRPPLRSRCEVNRSRFSLWRVPHNRWEVSMMIEKTQVLVGSNRRQRRLVAKGMAVLGVILMTVGNNTSIPLSIGGVMLAVGLALLGCASILTSRRRPGGFGPGLLFEIGLVLLLLDAIVTVQVLS